MAGMCLSFLSAAQHQQVQIHYDYAKKHLKEEYYVLKKNTQVRDSLYTSYFQNGQKKSQGNYVKNKAEGTWQFFYENGNIKMEGLMLNGEKNGVWQYYYENGSVSMEGEAAANLKGGHWKYYYENGHIRSEGEYQEDKKSGPWSYYYEDGVLKAMATYKEDAGDYIELYPSGKLKASGRIVDGKSSGVWNYYHEDGSLMATGEEEGGLKKGKWTYYYPNGLIASEGMYMNGKSVGPWKYYYENGTVSAVGNMNNGAKDGAWKIYYKSGQFKGETNYVNGEGVYKEYYEGGALRTEGKIIDDKHEGVWNYYLENGTLEGTCTYVNGTGLYKGYYESKKIKMEGTLENGNKVGVWTLYNEDGTIAGYYKTLYENQSPKLGSDSLILADTAKDTLKPSEKPTYFTPKKKSRYFTPRVNEAKAFIVSSNPFYMLASSFPVSVEYYMQERMGYEVGGLLYYKPMFNLHHNLPTNTVYYFGTELYVRQKFYQKDQEYGMLYFGHELRYGYYNYENDYIDFTVPVPADPVHLQQIQNRFEYAILVGDRVMLDQRKKGWTFDIYAGIGIGYRTISNNWHGNNDKYSDAFTGVYSKSFAVPFRFGFMIGYKFPKKKNN